MKYYLIYHFKYLIFKFRNIFNKLKRRFIYKKISKYEFSSIINNIAGNNDVGVSINYQDFDFSCFSKIVIVGPQRSGTTFFAHAIAKDLCYEFYDEIDFLVNDKYLFQFLLRGKGVVLQAPSLTHAIHRLVDDDVLVVYMSRDYKDILKSILKKNGFYSNNIFSINNISNFKRNYDKCSEVKKILDEVRPDEIYLETIFRIWISYQKKHIKNSICLSYDSLKTHPLWLDKSFRSDFHPKQVSQG